MRFGVSIVFLAACWGAPPPPVAPSNDAPMIAKPVSAEIAASVADPFGFLPIDGPIVGSIQFERIRGGGLWKAFGPALTERMAAIAVAGTSSQCADAYTSLTSLTFGFQSSDPPHGVIVVRGLDRAATIACIKTDKDRDVKIVGDTFITSMKSTQKNSAAMRFVDRSTLVVAVGGEPTTVADLDAVVRSGAPLRHSPGFMTLIDEVDRERAVWFVIGPDAKVLDGMGKLGGAHPRAMFASVDLVDFIAASAHVRLLDDATATTVASAFATQTGQFKVFVDRLDVTSQGSDVVFDIAVSEQQLTQLLGIAGITIP